MFFRSTCVCWMVSVFHPMREGIRLHIHGFPCRGLALG